MRKSGWFGALVALLIAVCAPATAHAQAKAPRSFFGVTPQLHLEPKDYSAMKKAGVGTLRFSVPWNDLDPLPESEEAIFTERLYAWWHVDPIVYQAAAQGITALPTIFGTPHWVASYQGCPSDCSKIGPTTVQGYIAFATFMRAAVKRYGPGGEFWQIYTNLPYRPIRTWQIWNEQNSSDFWKPEPNPEAYANLVIAGSAAVHAVDPGANVILGGMLGEPAQEGKATMSGWDFLASLYSNPRARDAFDGIAVHPYGKTVLQIRRTLQRWRQEMRKFGRRDPIWVTEVGWASGGVPHPLNRGVRGQAQLIDESFDFFIRNRGRLRIRNVDYFAWRDAAPGSDPCTWCAKAGLLRYRNHRPKPALKAYTAAARGR